MEENKKKIMGTLEENVAYMNEVLSVKESFDLVQRYCDRRKEKQLFLYRRVYKG